MRVEFKVETNRYRPAMGKTSVVFIIDTSDLSRADMMVLWEMERWLNSRTESRWHVNLLDSQDRVSPTPADPPGFKTELSPRKRLDARLFGVREFSPTETRAIQEVLDVLTEWPCEAFEGKSGGKHYAVDYTVSRARRGWRALQRFVRVFPQFKVE